MAFSQHTGLFYMNGVSGVVIKEFPVEFNRKIFKQLDSGFLIILAICAVILGSTVFVLSLRDLPDITTEEEIARIQERYAQLVLNQPKKKVEKIIEEVEAPIKKKTVDKGKEDAEEKKVKRKVDRKSESVVQRKQRKRVTQVDRRKRREAISREIQSSGIFAAITASGNGIGSSSAEVTDLLVSSDVIGNLGDVDISEGSFATQNVDVEDIKKRRGTKSSSIAIKKESVGRATGTQVASTGKIRITSEPPKLKGESAGKGMRNHATINNVVKKQQPRLKRVYESMLKRYPGLGGKIVIKFIIMPDGSVKDVMIIKSTTNNSRFDQRILMYIKRWKFPPISGGGPVEVVFPFVFSGSE